MHVEFLVEDSSGARFLEEILPKMLGLVDERHSWRIHKYKGIGRLRKGIVAGADASKRQLLDNLPRLLQGFARTPGKENVVVLIDSDRRVTEDFRSEVEALVSACVPALANHVIGIATEEVEAWYFGDRNAVLIAYPSAKRQILDSYVQDSICGTWELLADALHSGGAKRLKDEGFQAAGAAKHEWASKIGAKMDPLNNLSPSFNSFVADVKAMVE